MTARTLRPLAAPALLTLLLAMTAASGAHAAPLYKWVEADGSITFSPNPPPAGTAFERVGEPGADAQPTAAAELEAPAAAAAATADPMQAPANAPLPETEVSYAPPPLGAAIDARTGLQAGDPAIAPARASTTDADALDTSADARDDVQSASAQRQARCRELEKRVVSLERRLSTPLSPDDMDNTVLYMARYQQNVDRHCRS